MKICVAQTRPVKGDIEVNIENHKQLIRLAIANGANTIIFPELSITGYEPELAKELATDINDNRFDVFQTIADTSQITIGIGMPVKTNAGICITMILFQPQQPRQAYSKKYLHEDEEPYFVSGQNIINTISGHNNVALAICYELSVPEHSADAHKSGANIYLVSVAKTTAGIEKAYKSLSDIASKYSMTVLMSNCVGPCDNFVSAGQSAIWNNKGELLGQINDSDEGILMIDLESGEVMKRII